jgi:hypothetical protein
MSRMVELGQNTAWSTQAVQALPTQVAETLAQSMQGGPKLAHQWLLIPQEDGSQEPVFARTRPNQDNAVSLLRQAL